MGIGRQQFINVDLPYLRANTAGRAALRRQVAGLVAAGQEWLAKFDAQANAAPQAFADSRPAQFSAFEGSLPDVTIGNVDPDDAVP